MTINDLKPIWNQNRDKTITYKTTDYSITLNKNVHDIFLNWSEQKRDWIRDFKATPIKVTIGNKQVYVHQGVYEAFKELLESLLPRLKGVHRVRITGIAIGGGIAQLLHLHLKETTNIQVIQTVTFGAPKVFTIWKNFKYAKELCKDIVQVRYSKDIVSILPFWFLGGYKRVGSLLNIATVDKPKTFLDFLKKPFRDHGGYWVIFKDKNKKKQRGVKEL